MKKNTDLELEKLFVDAPVQEDELEKKIGKYIKKKIKTVTVKTVIAIVMIAAILFLIVSPVMNAIFLNPVKLQKDKTYESVLRSYYELTKPYVEIYSIDVRKKGFGRYELGISAGDPKKATYVGTENVNMDVVCGEYQNLYDPNMFLTKVIYPLQYPTSKEEQQMMIEDFQKLPESAQISLLVCENHVRDVAELRVEDVTLDWVEVYHPNQPDFRGGISLHKTIMVKETDWREEMTEAELLRVYQDNLQNLVNHPEIWEQIGISCHSTTWPNPLEKVKECYEDAKTLDQLQTQFYYISGERNEIVEYMKKTDMENVFVYSVKLSKWE